MYNFCSILLLDVLNVCFHVFYFIVSSHKKKKKRKKEKNNFYMNFLFVIICLIVKVDKTFYPFLFSL